MGTQRKWVKTKFYHICSKSITTIGQLKYLSKNYIEHPRLCIKCTYDGNVSKLLKEWIVNLKFLLKQPTYMYIGAV